MKNALAICLLFTAALTGCGEPLFYAELEEPALCKTVADVPFEPTVPGADLRLAFEVPIGQFIPLFDTEEAETTLFLNELTFNAKEGITDFNSVDSASLDVLPQDGSSLPRQLLLSYTRNPTFPPGRILTLVGDRDIELVPYLSNDEDKSARVEAVMKGALPNNYWTADVRVCLYMKARLNYARQFGL